MSRPLLDEDGQPLRMYCVACKSWVLPVERDHGLGRLEYWGAQVEHHDWRTECPECDGSDLLNYEPDEEVTHE